MDAGATNKENSPLVAPEKLEDINKERSQAQSTDLRAPRKPNNTSFVLKPVSLPKPLQI